MRGLAEYAMSGRRQAILVAVIFGLIYPLHPLSGAIVALVVLRRGLHEGLIVLLWALLPAGLHWLAGSRLPLVVLVGVALLAWVLRETQSWKKVLLAGTVLGLVLQLSLPLQTEYLAAFEEPIRQIIDERMEAGLSPVQIPQEGQMVDATPAQLVALVTNLYGAWVLLLFTMSLMIGRAWQARLYNPGGFRQEFHNLRIDPLVMAAIFGIVVAGIYGISPIAELLSLFCVIPMLVGLAVIHSAVASLKLGFVGLVLTYVLIYLVLVLASVFMVPAVVLLGFVDSVIDIRVRLKKNSDLPKD